MPHPFQSTHIEFHVLQSFPVTCLNRDDVGAPKSAVVGGVTRARVSSQCWKRQVRQELNKLGVKIGKRTKQLENLITDACIRIEAPEEKARQCGQAFAKELADDTLFFFSDREAEAFAEYAKTLAFDAAKIKAKDIAKIAKKALNPSLDGLDIALFGRMVAKAPEMNVEAAASFAHAISTHKASNEVEFFTALDDLREEPGSAHMGSLEFNSATYYRYISLDLGQLYTNFYGGGPCDAERLKDIQGAVEAFTKALYSAVPAARQATQSGASFWDYASVLVRKGQRLQASFDTPVSAKGGGYLAPSIKALESFLLKKEEEAGSLFQKQGVIVLGPDSRESIDSIVAFLKDMLAKAGS
ncbi:MAG: type I-E CRISPR-associated protein Cas7/Cse4/CasC [Deltaproteobacteria bacterium]|nr:type I-E CRISPR-associated protein Cas7/Cse4/CasC [Deltaproteobacteria bacterium]